MSKLCPKQGQQTYGTIETPKPITAYGTIETPKPITHQPEETPQDHQVKDFNSIVFDSLEHESDYEEDMILEAEEEPVVDTSIMSWPSYLFHYTCLTGKGTLKVADGMGEWLADFFGITGPKYWYIIREYERQKEEEEREKAEDLLSDNKNKLESGVM